MVIAMMTLFYKSCDTHLSHNTNYGRIMVQVTVLYALLAQFLDTRFVTGQIKTYIVKPSNET